MYNGKYISYKEVIENVYRDFKFQYVFQVADAIEWLGSALRQLKIPRYYLDKLTDNNKDLFHQDYITIEDYRGKLPCDLYSITQTAYVYDKNDARCATANCVVSMTGLSYYDIDTGETCATGDGTALCNQFVLNSSCASEDCEESSCSCNDSSSCSCDCTENITYIPMRWNTNTFYKSYHGCDLDYICQSNLTYTVNNNYIFTNFQSGRICMAYKAIPTDSDGYPLIPDNESVINYVKWFIAEKIAFQLFLTDKYTERKYEYFASNLQLYFRKAKNEGKMLANVDEWESYQNMRIKSIKEPVAHRSFFGNMQIPEFRTNNPGSNNKTFP
jgi:hypothetical protein